MKTQSILPGIFALVILLMGEIKAQAFRHADEKSINLELSISLEGSHKRDTAYVINIKNLTLKQEKTIHTGNKTLLHLDYNSQFQITVSHNGYSTKIVELDTEAPVDKWIIMADVNLENKNKQTVKAGKIAFDKESKTFKAVKKI